MALLRLSGPKGPFRYETPLVISPRFDAQGKGDDAHALAAAVSHAVLSEFFTRLLQFLVSDERVAITGLGVLDCFPVYGKDSVPGARLLITVRTPDGASAKMDELNKEISTLAGDGDVIEGPAERLVAEHDQAVADYVEEILTAAGFATDVSPSGLN